MKYCNRCDQTKSLDEFGKNRGNKTGYEHWCKQCYVKYQVEKKYYNKCFVKYEAGVYKIKNLLTGECYIGASTRPYRRRAQHFSTHSVNKSNFTSNRLQEAMEQYGHGSFVFGIIEYCSKDKLKETEKQYISIYKPEYNINLVY
jgi:predicted GIY-YIG superfamily endonuclease